METGHPNPPLTRRLPGLSVAAIASLGAGAVHAAATGIHAEHPELARLFVVTAAAQLAAGLWALLRPARVAAWAVAAVNAAAVVGWLATRLGDYSIGLYLAGGMMVVGTVLLAILKLVEKRDAAVALQPCLQN